MCHCCLLELEHMAFMFENMMDEVWTKRLEGVQYLSVLSLVEGDEKLGVVLKEGFEPKRQCFVAAEPGKKKLVNYDSLAPVFSRCE